MSSGFEFPFDVRPDGRDPYRVVADTRDLSAWERWPGTLPGGVKRTIKAITDDMMISAVEEIAFQASKRQGLWTENLNTFRERCRVDMGDDGADSGSDPTQ